MKYKIKVCAGVHVWVYVSVRYWTMGFKSEKTSWKEMQKLDH